MLKSKHLFWILVIALLAVIAMGKSGMAFPGMGCMCARGKKENMAGPMSIGGEAMPVNCGEMCARLESDNYGSNDYTTVV